MRPVSRRIALACISTVAIVRGARARSAKPITVAADDGPVVLSRYAADRTGARPAVLLLHGARGIDLEPRAYERYANALAAAGIDAYLVRYFTAADARALNFREGPDEC